MMTLFTLTMMAVIELGVVFWVGIHLWQRLSFYYALARHEEERVTHHQVQDRFARRMALPILLVLLLAHIALVVEKAVTLSSGNAALLWLVRVLILLLAVHLSLTQRRLRQVQKVSPRITSLLSWINLLLGLVLFVALALSNDTAAAPVTIITPAALADFLYLLAAALWIGGMLSIATCSFPISSVRSFAERVHSQIILLPSSFPWVVAGVVFMAIA